VRASNDRGNENCHEGAGPIGCDLPAAAEHG
jgi:hypothetical protein